MEPQATVRVCGVNCQASSQVCTRLYESWPGNSIDLYAWYQTRTIRWCRGWVSILYCRSKKLPDGMLLLNSSGTHVDLAGGVDVAGVLWTIVGHLAVAVGEQCIQVAIPAIVPLVLPEPTTSSTNIIANMHTIHSSSKHIN